MAPYRDCCSVEPPLAEVLGDPIVSLLMDRDRVTRHELAALIQQAQGALSKLNDGPATAAHG